VPNNQIIADKSHINDEVILRQPSVISNNQVVDRYDRGKPQNNNQDTTKIFSPHHKAADNNFKESLQII